MKEPVPILLQCAPYGVQKAPDTTPPNLQGLTDEGYIFVFLNLRGRFKSKGFRSPTLSGGPKRKSSGVFLALKSVEQTADLCHDMQLSYRRRESRTVQWAGRTLNE
jgi:hypothetical protein